MLGAPSSITVAKLIKACSTEQWPKILQLLRELQASRLKQDVVPYSSAVTKLSRSESWQKALLLHMDMRRQRLGDLGAYAALLTACRVGAAWCAALALLRELRSAGMQPDTVCSNAVVSALTRATQLSKALLGHLAWETANMNSILMSLRHIPTSWTHALHVLEHMQRRRIPADVGTLKSAMSICGNSRPDLVPGLSRQLQVQPDTVALNMHLGFLEKRHDWQAALHELRSLNPELGGTGLRPELITYNTAISACSKAARWAWALELLAAMVSSALKPDEVTTGSLITACSTTGRWLLALQLLVASNQSPPNLIAVHSAITACEKAGQWMWSLHLFSDAVASRLAPDIGLLGAVLSSFEKAQQWTRSLQLLSQMSRERTIPYPHAPELNPPHTKPNPCGKLRNRLQL